MPKTEEEFEDLTSYLDSVSASIHHVWLGIHGRWPYKFLDGTELDRWDSRWKSGHPMGYACTSLTKVVHDSSWQFADNCCWRRYPVVCELEGKSCYI